MISKIQYGDKIVADDNLVFYIDAYKDINGYNNFSPSTTQSFWYDLSNYGGDIQTRAFTYSTENNGHFVITGSSTDNSRAGIGQSDALNVGTSGQTTIEIFFSASSQTAAGCLFSYGSDATSNTSSYWIGLNPSSVSASRMLIGVEAAQLGSSPAYLFFTGSWYCATIILGPFGSTSTLYVNGISTGSFGAVNLPTSSLGNYMYIGKRAPTSGTNRPVTGPIRIGSIKVWNKALSDSEILLSYNTTKGRYGL